jgi:TPR repeat protein
MARASSALALLLIAILGAPTLRATESLQAPPPLARRSNADDPLPLAWLKSGNYVALEAFYSQQQQDYEAGRISDEALYSTFRKLYEDSLDNERSFDRWVQVYPSSYPAMLARGAYLYRMAWSVRGDKYLRETSAPQIDAMENWLARSRPDLLASLKLTAKPYLSALYLLNVATLQGTAVERRRWYEEGTAMDPNNALVRYRYMSSLRPRWGGSYERMQDFLRQCEEQHLPPRLLARLKMLIHADLAEDAMRTADTQKIFDEWHAVVTLAAAAGEDPSTEALIGFTRAAQDLNRPADAEQGLQQLEGRNPDDAWSQARLGWIDARAHQEGKAWPLLVRAAEQNDPWAQFVVGHGTYDGLPTLHKAPDQQAGLVWIRRSATQCFSDAVQFLAVHGEKQYASCKRHSTGSGDWWAALARIAGGALLTSLVTGWMAVSRKREAVPGHPGRMHHPRSTLFLGLLILGFFVALGLASIVYDNDSGGPLMSALFAGFGMLGLLMIVEYFRAYHELTVDGLDFGRLLGPRGSLKWRDVTRLSYSKGLRWFRIETSSGEVARISAMLTGLPEFARAAREHVPSYAIDDSAREMLEACAHGQLPGLAG